MQRHPVGAPLADCPGGTTPATVARDILPDLAATQFPHWLRGLDPAPAAARIVSRTRAARQAPPTSTERSRVIQG